MDLNFTHRGVSFPVSVIRNGTLRELGEQLRQITGIAPHTMKLLVPGNVRPALQPFSDEHAHLVVEDCRLEGKHVRLMGSFPSELIQASQASVNDTRILGFAEEEDRARQRSKPVSENIILPQGPYVFSAFKTVELPGVQMTPPASKALQLMHILASDRGIVAIMNKYKWRVGIMTEMAPEGFVGVSEKCLLGFNKNHGQEISLRLRTDDLRGFRKYESIKKTLLHELAHMIHSEHDDDFYRLDRKLNKEAIELDWTKAKGHTVSRMKYEYLEDDNEIPTAQGHRLGGNISAASLDPRTAVAIAAINRYQVSNEPDPDDASDGNRKNPEDIIIAEPDPDDGIENKREAVEPDPEDMHETFRLLSKTGREEAGHYHGDGTKHEPDPDDKAENAPDPEDGTRKNEPDPDDKMEMDVSDDPGLERIYEAATNASYRVKMSLAKLKSEASPSEVSIACQTMFTILRNVMEHPYDEKYRRIRKANALFRQRVARFQAAIELLKVVGFSDELENRDCFILRHNDPGLLWIARSSLEAMA